MAGGIVVEGGQKEALDLLETIPGIGPILALHLYAFFSTFSDANRGEIVALAGTSVHSKSHIIKRGNKRLRKTLFQVTLSAARYNPKIKALYLRLKTIGKPDKVARIAADRKLLLIAFAIFKSGKPFTADCPITNRCDTRDETEERCSDSACQKEATSANKYAKRGKTLSSMIHSHSRRVATYKCMRDKIPLTP